ncbi:DNA-directed RNA polymerases IV and V subunit 2-like [Telopea speciosissima]|uniref:DNA-directed RNA polymerases IV and V subunit 2-like n=1 Tax=Telopea speciosissima TaxID=54955 RepID=UPI001CC6DC52|nr:DNA-directed RNA polymerases IV and V subunit 2-like [Telopea speciosissima]XP_043716100.1 DNA-directed RNA polymerases IV and V subunit 2-like [Telopea speciosissima]
MGEPEAKDDSGMSSEGEKFPDEMDMDFDQNGNVGTSKLPNVVNMDVDKSGEVGTSEAPELSEELLSKFRREASKLFFNEYGLIGHQIDSYNDFVERGIQKVFDSVGEITVEPGFDPSKKGKGQGDWRYASVSFGEITFEKPMFWTAGSGTDDNKLLKLMPWHARLQHMSYSGRLKVKIKVQVYTQKLMKSDKFKTGIEQFIEKDVQSEEERDVVVGRIPVMVRSKRCWLDGLDKNDCDFDHGGYFLIKGAEKTFIAQEQICLRRLWVSSKPTWTVAYRSDLKRRRVYMKLIEPAKLEEAHKGKILNVYFLVATMPIWILFFALGISSDKEIIDMIDLDINDATFRNILFSSILDADKECNDFRKNGKALKYVDELFKKAKFPPKECTEDCFKDHLFPALTGLRQKALFLAYMVKCLLLSYTGKRKCENRDDFRNKRLELSGDLLERELRVHIKHAERRMVKALQRDLYGDRNLHPIEHYLDASIITNGLCRAFSTGAWSHPFKNERMSGVVANLRRTNPLQMMVDLRKTRQHVGYTGRVGDARFPHPSHWGRLCFLSTPDGENCGLVKNFAVTGLVSTYLMEPLVNKLLDCGMEKLTDNQSTAFLSRNAKVFLNGEWVGSCEDCLSFVADLRAKRRIKEIPPQVEIKCDRAQGEVRIFSDPGRILRPLIIVEKLRKIKEFKGGAYTFQSLLDKGVIELLGVEEEEDCQTAWSIKDILGGDKGKNYTHLELDLSFLMGLSCGLIPFANHNHARRILYESEKHSQQAIGFSTTNPYIRVDTLSHQLYYPQVPLFRTMVSECLGTSQYPQGQGGFIPRPEFYNGQNAIVAVNVHLGYNQEDSLVMNRASLERGMFRTEHIRSYKADVDNKELLATRRQKPKDRVEFAKIQSKIGRVDSLDDDGFPHVGANLQTGDIVIGRCAESGADHSIKLKHTERGTVQKVILSANDDGKNFAVVSLRQVRSPCLGDKFSSMHGQKGVVGLLESQEDFPFTLQGIVPDIVINPHAFPTRQTLGQLFESALGKGIACDGSVRYATPFSTPSIDDVTNQLRRAGYERWGSEKFCNGRTGEMMQSLIFVGPTFYQRLIHMAEDKVKFRNTGPVHPLTRQPVSDRKRFGGVKFGEMERDCLIAHGASANLHERLFTLSDFSQMHICQKCTNIANVIQRSLPGGRKIRGPYCRFCESAENIVKVNVPYGAKLLCQELFSMGISVKFDTQVC